MTQQVQAQKSQEQARDRTVKTDNIQGVLYSHVLPSSCFNYYHDLVRNVRYVNS